MPRESLARPPRLLVTALSAASFAVALLALLRALAERQRQGWDGLGYRWLTLDVWSRELDLKRGGAAALLAALAAWIACSGWGRRQPWLAPARWLHLATSRLPVMLVLACGAFVLPPAIARGLRPPPPPGARNVLLVMIDSLRADHVGWLHPGCGTTPGLDRLAEQGVVFENVISVAPWTGPSVATLLTGITPSWHGMVSNVVPGKRSRGTRLAADRLSWMEVLAAQGFETAMWTNNPNVRAQNGFAQGVHFLKDYTTDPRRGPYFKPGPVEEVLADVRAWLDGGRDRSRPFAAYVHLMEPHYPHQAPQPFAGRFESGDCDVELTGILYREFLMKPDLRRSVTPDVVAHLKARYDEEILRMDASLAPFLKRLRAEQPDTVVVLVADHGEEFLDHGFLGHSHSVYQELLRVPLVVWAPQLAAERVPWQVRTLDVAPTIVELAGARAPETAAMPFQGASLVSLEPEHRLAPFEVGGDYFPPHQWRGITDGAWKVIRRLPNQPDYDFRIPILEPELEGADGEKIPFDCLYDLRRDPGERTSLLADQPSIAERLWTAMRDRGWYDPQPWNRDAGSAVEPAADDPIELLRALGYADR